MSRRVRGWRKLAGAAWSAPSDPQFYGDLEIDAGTLQEYRRTIEDTTGVHCTITHLVGKAVAHGLAEVPSLQVRLAHGREYDRKSVDVFFIVSAEGGELTGVKIEQADTKSVAELAVELTNSTTAIADGSDAAFGRVKRLMDVLPPWALRRAFRLSAWLTSDLDLDLPRLGLRREAFGGAMITSVGMWGVSRAYSPLASYYRVPLLVLVGAGHERPVAITGRVVVRPMLTLTATFDHRYVDGSHAARFAQAVRDYCADPARYEP